MIEEVVVVAPRGFCAGVARSIKAVEEALRIYGKPVYIKHAIVHNKTVVNDLEKQGAITVESVEEIPEGSVVVFSAHGSPPEHYALAQQKNIRVIDATCPLVTKVHMEMCKYVMDGFHVIYIGHKGHVEGLGVIGEAQKLGVEVPVVETIQDIDALTYEKDAKIALLTQTTLSCEETKILIDSVKRKYPHTIEPAAQDICYATTNRQNAIRALAEEVDCVIIVGSQTSSNSKRLRETAQQIGCPSFLVDSVEEIDDAWIENVRSVGVSAGASAPEHKVQEIVAYFLARGARRRDHVLTVENVQFTEPIALMKARR
jgi:4-hydroxy-3-methylbut-2-enyl diphosphate reductase